MLMARRNARLSRASRTRSPAQWRSSLSGLRRKALMDIRRESRSDARSETRNGSACSLIRTFSTLPRTAIPRTPSVKMLVALSAQRRIGVSSTVTCCDECWMCSVFSETWCSSNATSASRAFRRSIRTSRRLSNRKRRLRAQSTLPSGIRCRPTGMQ